jgi:hypothetical protein
MTHDLLLSLMNQTGLSLDRVEVHSLKDNTFHARLVIHGGAYSEKRPLMLDTRPSDAFALAVRRKCPIFISCRVLDQTGIPADFILEGIDDPGAESPSGSLSSPAVSRPDKYLELIEELNRVIDAEEYERAAEIRDMLIRLDKDRLDRDR